MKPANTPYDRILWSDDQVQIGVFSCPVDDPYFCDTGPIENNIIVFPQHEVAVSRKNLANTAVMNTHWLMLYNEGEEYTRSPISDAGDYTHWLALSDDLLCELEQQLPRLVNSNTAMPFQQYLHSCPAHAYLLQQGLFHYLLHCRQPDTLLVHESVRRVIAASFASASPTIDYWQRKNQTVVRHRQQVSNAQAYISKHYRTKLTLHEIASAVHVSAYHLARLFTQFTGSTMHAYITGLRLRRALRQLREQRFSVTQAAFDNGFANPSHFSAAFRRHFQISPSELDRQRINDLLAF